MYIVIIEDYPSQCMEQLQIEHFETEAEAIAFAHSLDEDKSKYAQPTMIKVYREELKIKTHTDRFLYT